MSNGSPRTSETISETNRPARQALSRPPPLIRLNRFRTVLSCSMFAPAALRCRVTASLSASVMPFDRGRHQRRAAAGNQT